MKKYNRPLLSIETISILNSIANDVSGVKETVTFGPTINGPTVQFSDWEDWN